MVSYGHGLQTLPDLQAVHRRQYRKENAVAAMYDLERNLTNHPPVDQTIVHRMESIRTAAKDYAATIDGLCPPCREQSLAFTNLEQSLMWAIASIARNQGEP